MNILYIDKIKVKLVLSTYDHHPRDILGEQRFYIHSNYREEYYFMLSIKTLYLKGDDHYYDSSLFFEGNAEKSNDVMFITSLDITYVEGKPKEYYHRLLESFGDEYYDPHIIKNNKDTFSFLFNTRRNTVVLKTRPWAYTI